MMMLLGGTFLSGSQSESKDDSPLRLGLGVTVRATGP
jgi:hypothetical protein